jgi:LTXXQ motif family protein
MPGRIARGLLIIISLGALCLWSNPAQSRFGGHFGGGFRGGGFGHFGGMRFGGMRFGGHHFGGMRFGGHHFGGMRFAHRSFSHHQGLGHFQRHALAGHHRMGTGGHQAARHIQSPHRLANRSNRLAHAAIAGAGLHQIHGFSNFNRHPFNRNGFGDRVAWNRFEHRFSRRCCGWFGPVFWPFVIGDILTAVLWPWDEYDPFWYFGSDYILSSIFWVGYGAGSGYAASDVYDIYGNGARRRSVSSQSERIEGANGPAAHAALNEACVGFAPGVTSLPMSRIQREVQPIGDQLAPFEELKAALTKADEMIRASCSNEVPLTPVKRLEVVQARLNAMAVVFRIVKTPLGEFYNSLTAMQRQRFDAVRGEVATRRVQARMASGNDLAALCSERAAAFSQVPAQRIEETIRPTPEQRGAFDALKMASANAAGGLRSSCPARMPTPIMDRLDAVDARLAAMLSAVEIVRPALGVFYASLTDEQKARFNSWGPQTQVGATSD